MIRTFIIVLTLMINSVHGQSLERFVVSSSGSYTETSTVGLSATIGEVVVVTSQRTSLTLTQGFQQADTSGGVGIYSVMMEGFSISLYPNPASTELVVELSAPDAFDYQLEIFDVLGKRQAAKIESHGSSSAKTTFDVSDFPDGLYLLTVKSNSAELFKTIKFQKVGY